MASTIADLPAELIEAVLVMAAASGNPNSIAALSQTNKLFYRLIYCCPDQHLWREIFLTTFDDPRPALNHMNTMSGGHPNLELNWTQEYIDRISAASSQSEVLRIPASLSAVKALLSVIATSLPFPSSLPLSLTVLTEFPVSRPAIPQTHSAVPALYPLPPCPAVSTSAPPDSAFTSDEDDDMPPLPITRPRYLVACLRHAIPQTRTPAGHDDDDDDDGDEDEDEEEPSELDLMIFGNRLPAPDLSPPIEPYELIPDYVWLASARIVVEANLREVSKQSPYPAAFSMGDICRGSPGPREGSETGKSNHDEVEGWDWAGVSGIWK
ncbi:hypothetical protein EDD22DRAFT_902271 [Suillus occidentalis]|nr:hypothetical protein EDD22DRAFT_902271 [Suillus occidentalis]